VHGTSGPHDIRHRLLGPDCNLMLCCGHGSEATGGHVCPSPEANRDVKSIVVTLDAWAHGCSSELFAVPSSSKPGSGARPGGLLLCYMVSSEVNMLAVQWPEAMQHLYEEKHDMYLFAQQLG
jgi:hypothetical protein